MKILTDEIITSALSNILKGGGCSESLRYQLNFALRSENIGLARKLFFDIVDMSDFDVQRKYRDHIKFLIKVYNGRRRNDNRNS